jgi:hypothetical protein
MNLKTARTRLARKASQIVVGGFRPPERLDASFGRVRLARVDERWPMHTGKPMIPLCQLNLTEAPYVPANLKDIALLTIFIAADAFPVDTPNGDGWELRAYSSLEGLTELVEPDHGSGLRPLPIRWELIERDYPSYEDAPEELLESLNGEDSSDFEVAHCSKIGGWPSLIQGELSWGSSDPGQDDFEYAFQIASEEKSQWAWGDSGIGYFGRGTGSSAGVWALSWQSY